MFPAASFPAVIDNTIRKAFVTCPTMMKYRHTMNLRCVDEKMVDLLFGSAFATGCEVARRNYYERRLDSKASMNYGIDAAMAQYGDFVTPPKSNKTLYALERSLRYYFEQWPLGEDGLTPMEDGIECTFSIPLPMSHPDTGEPLHYAGRYDMRATNVAKQIILVDEKTTSKFSDSWLDQWDIDTQMTGYIWSVKQAYPVSKMPEVQAQIRGISVLLRDNGHVELPVIRSDWQIQQWYEQLLHDINRMIKSYKNGEWDLALHGNACVQYGRRCDFMPLCLTPQPEQRIEGNYKVVVWNPLTRGTS